MRGKQWKCLSGEAPKESFYLVQKYEKQTRYVISLQSPEDALLLLYNFIRKSRYLDLKIRDMDNNENPTDYVGMLGRKKLLVILEKNEDILLGNVFFEFMAKNSRTGEYIVFDDHGLLFIYSNKDYASFIEQVDVSRNDEAKLIYEYNHWHNGPAGHREALQHFIKELEMHEE
ncbi:MAG: hypothetical protein ACFHU9_17935 [Fluviicola sp.]